MTTERVIASLLRVAAEDLEGAKLLAKQRNRNAVYLLSQAAEKIIKAILTSEAVHAGIKHQLDLLVDQVPDENPIKPLLRDIERLADYATAFRYPTPTGRVKASPPPDELAAWSTKVEAALDFAVGAFEVDLTTEAPAGQNNPIR